MHVLLIEDDAQIAASISTMLAAENISVDHATTAEEGLKRAGLAPVDVIIMDWMLPGISGIEAVARLRSAGVEKPILMLSALGRADHRVEGLNSGADDYIAKPFEPTELVARLRALHRRTNVLASQPVLIHGDIELNVRARTAHRGSRHLGLSPKEFELLKFLMENADNIVTRDMMLSRVWNLNFDPQTNVIDVHIVRLRRKLEEASEQACLETVRGHGYRLLTPQAATSTGS